MASLRGKLERIERKEIIRALQECKWVKAKAARSSVLLKG